MGGTILFADQEEHMLNMLRKPEPQHVSVASTIPALRMARHRKPVAIEVAFGQLDVPSGAQGNKYQKHVQPWPVKCHGASTAPDVPPHTASATKLPRAAAAATAAQGEAARQPSLAAGNWHRYLQWKQHHRSTPQPSPGNSQPESPLSAGHRSPWLYEEDEDSGALQQPSRRMPPVRSRSPSPAPSRTPSRAPSGVVTPMRSPSPAQSPGAVTPSHPSAHPLKFTSAQRQKELMQLAVTLEGYVQSPADRGTGATGRSRPCRSLSLTQLASRQVASCACGSEACAYCHPSRWIADGAPDACPSTSVKVETDSSCNKWKRFSRSISMPDEEWMDAVLDAALASVGKQGEQPGTALQADEAVAEHVTHSQPDEQSAEKQAIDLNTQGLDNDHHVQPTPDREVTAVAQQPGAGRKQLWVSSGSFAFQPASNA